MININDDGKFEKLRIKVVGLTEKMIAKIVNLILAMILKMFKFNYSFKIYNIFLNILLIFKWVITVLQFLKPCSIIEKENKRRCPDVYKF